jgi:hypothetical protein
MKRPDWFVWILLRVGIFWRNMKSRFDFGAELHTREKLETLPCGHGVAKEYRNESGEVVRQDYTVIVSDHALPSAGSTSVNQ